MPQQQNELSGILGKNDRQREGKNDPGYQGSCTINGVAYWISAWLKDGTEGRGKFFSLSFRPKNGAPPARQGPPPASRPTGAAPARPQKPTPPQPDLPMDGPPDDDVPF